MIKSGQKSESKGKIGEKGHKLKSFLHLALANRCKAGFFFFFFDAKLLIILRYSYLLDDCNYFVVTCSAVDKVLNAYYVKLLAPPTIIHPLYSKKNKNGTVH